MNFRKVVLVLFSLVVSLSLLSQSISRSVIGSCGTTQSSEGSKISWTIGEPIIGTMTCNQYQLANGFFPSLNYSLLVTPEKEMMTTIEIFPNPANDFLIIRNKDQHEMIISIKAVDGNEVFNQHLKSGEKIRTSEWPQGIYLVNVTDAEKNLTNSYKVILSK